VPFDGVNIEVEDPALDGIRHLFDGIRRPCGGINIEVKVEDPALDGIRHLFDGIRPSLDGINYQWMTLLRG